MHGTCIKIIKYTNKNMSYFLITKSKYVKLNEFRSLLYCHLFLLTCVVQVGEKSP
jgi:hypothetical protein